jgi:hypothetical protein
MKNSGGEAGGNPNAVLDLALRDAEILCDIGNAVAGSEAVDEVLNPGAAVNDERLSELALRIDDHVSDRVGRKLDACCPAVAVVAAH